MIDKRTGMFNLSGFETGRAAKMRTASLGGLQSCARALDGQASLKLGKRTHHMKNQMTTRVAGVDGIGQAAEIYLTRTQLGHKANQMGKRAAKPVEFPNDERVTLVQRRKGTVQSALGDNAAADTLIGKNLFAPGNSQSVPL